MSEDDAAEDDDWFERALQGDADDSSVDREPVGDREPSSPSEGGSDAETGESSSTTEQAAPAESADETPFDAADPEPDELDAAFEAATAAASESEEAVDPFGGGDGAGFGMGQAGDASSGNDGSGAGGGGDVAGGRGEMAGAGADGTGGGDGLFDDDFASAFGASGGDEAFDDEDFESDIPRLDVGIDGLDRMIRGGVPRRHLMVAIGSAGTGKTTFGLQYLNHGLENGENGVFITLEQTHEAIVDTASEYGWDFEAYEAENELAVVDLDPIEMANSLDNIRGELPALIEEFDADRFVLDSVSLLEMMYDEQASRRTEVFDFTRSLKQAGVTTLLTSEADEDNAYASRHGIIEYLTDAVFVLQYVRAETRETRLAVEIQKIRNANHSRETKPYEITDNGISVYEQANIF